MSMSSLQGRMRRLRFILSVTARDELRERLAYMVDHSDTPKAAHRFIDDIRARCRALCDLPMVGHDRSDIRMGLRTIAFKSIVIVFEVSETTLLIKHVYGAMQDLERLLQED